MRSNVIYNSDCKNEDTIRATNDTKNDQLNLVLKEKGRNLIVGELTKVVTRITSLVYVPFISV